MSQTIPERIEFLVARTIRMDPPERCSNALLASLERQLESLIAGGNRNKDLKKRHKALRRERLARYADGTMSREGYGDFQE